MSNAQADWLWVIFGAGLVIVCVLALASMIRDEWRERRQDARDAVELPFDPARPVPVLPGKRIRF